MTDRDKYINAITDKRIRKQVYDGAHAALPKNQCAYTQYRFLVRAGVIPERKPYPTFTGQIEHILLTECKGVKRIVTPALLQRGDICFSRNANKIPGPDHVYAMHTPQGAFAQVVDNYAVGPHRRNITAAGPKTPFDYALRLAG